jgi:hypothetical protein
MATWFGQAIPTLDEELLGHSFAMRWMFNVIIKELPKILVDRYISIRTIMFPEEKLKLKCTTVEKLGQVQLESI